METITKFVRKLYNKVVHSIAFFPAAIAVGFILFAMLTLQLDSEGAGERLNERAKWLTLKDAETARTIVSTVCTGIISLMVFSFSMVMIVMNQAASQMSNRMLDKIIGDRYQKIVLGFYIGTIVYGLFLLTNISKSGGPTKVPTLSVYFLLTFTIADILLFVYFLHHITQTFRYEQLIKRIHRGTVKMLKRWTSTSAEGKELTVSPDGKEVLARESGYFQGFSLKRLMKLAIKHNITIIFLHTEGSFVLKDTPFLKIAGSDIDGACLDRIFLDIDFYYGQEIDRNPYYGFRHLMEVGVKALSPGINDPGTAALSLHSLTDLLAYKMHNKITEVIPGPDGNPRIITKEISFEELFKQFVMPIWDYGKNDRLVQQTIRKMVSQLSYIDKENKYAYLWESLAEDVKSIEK